MDLLWEQKFQALQSLAAYPDNAQIKMRKPGDWYCSIKGIEVKKAHVLVGGYGNGSTPQQAVESCFKILTTLPSDEYIVRGGLSADRRYFRWNGFMWQEHEVRDGCSESSLERHEARGGDLVLSRNLSKDPGQV